MQLAAADFNSVASPRRPHHDFSELMMRPSLKKFSRMDCD
jgi:hypothetical protein